MKRLLFCIGLLATPALAQVEPADDELLSIVEDDDSAEVANSDTDGRGHQVCVAVAGSGLRQQLNVRQKLALRQQGFLKRFRGHGLTKVMAAKRALRKCKGNSFAPNTCHITYCRPSLLRHPHRESIE